MGGLGQVQAALNCRTAAVFWARVFVSLLVAGCACVLRMYILQDDHQQDADDQVVHALCCCITRLVW
jgi:hypothetical protein